MKNITSSINNYRECVRHLWNIHFFYKLKEERIYDAKDEFDDICVSLFSSLVLKPIGCASLEKAKAYQRIQDPINCLFVTLVSESGLPIHVNRELPPSGYWDYYAGLIRPDDVDMRFIDCFDFGQYQFRDFEYYKVRIVASKMNAEFIGRDALIRASHAEIFYDSKKGAAVGGNRGTSYNVPVKRKN